MGLLANRLSSRDLNCEHDSNTTTYSESCIPDTLSNGDTDQSHQIILAIHRTAAVGHDKVNPLENQPGKTIRPNETRLPCQNRLNLDNCFRIINFTAIRRPILVPIFYFVQV